MSFVNLNEVFLPAIGGTVNGDVGVEGAMTVNTGNGDGTTYDVAAEIAELKSAWDSVSQKSVYTGDDVITNYEDYFTITNIKCVTRAGIAHIYMNFKTLVDIPTGTAVCNLSSNLKPTLPFVFAMYTNSGEYLRSTSGGTIYNVGDMPANATYYLASAYILAQ